MNRAANLKAAFLESDIRWRKPETLFWAAEGPKISFMFGVLRISDLNPEVDLAWRMRRWEMLKLGLKFVKVALRP
jgi:hypothetical protein